MKETVGRNGGRLKSMEKGDTSPNKGKHRTSTASLLAVLHREKSPRTEKKQLDEMTTYMFEKTRKELEELLRTGKLPVVVAVMVKAWLDKKKGFDNMCKSLEMVFGKPTERKEISGELSMAALLMESGMLDEEDAEEAGDEE